MRKIPDITQDNISLGGLGRTLFVGGLAAGLIGIAVSLGIAATSEHGFDRFAWAYLLNFVYFTSLGLGALFWVIIQHITRSGWSVLVRRLLEGIAGSLPWLAVLSLPIPLFFMHTLFFWTHEDVRQTDPLVMHKLAYLNEEFFYVRFAIYVIFFAFASIVLYRRSVAQDADGDPKHTAAMEGHSLWMIFLFALTVTFFAFDLVMGLDAHWFSTIFGVYFFAGCSLGSLSLLAVTTALLQRTGRLQSVTVEHYHDIGKLMFGFVVFWAYIAFSQYMLIWYAHIPEETGWYLRRQEGPWLWVSIFLIFFHFALPFLALISRIPKRNKAVLATAGVYLLAVHWVDLYWLIMPENRPHGAHAEAATGGVFSPLDLTLFVGIGGFFVAAIARRLGRASLVPEKDPRLVESLTFENA